MSNWSNCDIRLVVALAFSFAVMLVGVTYVMIKLYNKLERIERLVSPKKSEPNQKELISCNKGEADNG